MNIHQPLKYAIRPNGTKLYLHELPKPDSKRWTCAMKADVLTAVRDGLLTLEQACERYRMTVDEYLSWQRAFYKHGVPGLRSTKLQVYPR